MIFPTINSIHSHCIAKKKRNTQKKYTQLFIVNIICTAAAWNNTVGAISTVRRLNLHQNRKETNKHQINWWKTKNETLKTFETRVIFGARSKNTKLYTSLFSSTADMRFKYKPIVTSVSEVPVELRTRIFAHADAKRRREVECARVGGKRQSTAKECRYEIDERKKKTKIMKKNNGCGSFE